MWLGVKFSCLMASPLGTTFLLCIIVVINCCELSPANTQRNDYVFITFCVCKDTNVHQIQSVSCMVSSYMSMLTHWGRVTHISVGKLTIIGSDNGLSPDRRRVIILTNAGKLLIGPLGTNFSEILIEIQTFSFKIMRLKTSSAKWRPFCIGLNVLILEIPWHYNPSSSCIAQLAFKYRSMAVSDDKASRGSSLVQKIPGDHFNKDFPS